MVKFYCRVDFHPLMQFVFSLLTSTIVCSVDIVLRVLVKGKIDNKGNEWNQSDECFSFDMLFSSNHIVSF